jgi:hypothetical protein
MTLTQSAEEVREERKIQVALGYRIFAAQRAADLSRGRARYAQKDLTRYGAGRVVFHALVARHIGDPSVVSR